MRKVILAPGFVSSSMQTIDIDKNKGTKYAHPNLVYNGVPEQVSQARRSYEKYPAIFTRMVGGATNG